MFNNYLNSRTTLPGVSTAAARFTNIPKGLALTLFVFWILTDNSDRSFSFDDLAFLADRFYR